MTRGTDMRQRVMVNALADPDIGHAERVFLFAVAMLPTEYVEGERRPGSRGMDARGIFALHYDYLARALHTSPTNAKKIAQRLTSKGWLSKRHAGTFGRPAGWQALDVRGDMTYRVTDFRFVPPYELYERAIRRDTTSPLTYRTPDHPDHAPAVGGFQQPSDWGDGSNEQVPPEAAVDHRRPATHDREASA